jgi:hypothetical protein
MNQSSVCSIIYVKRVTGMKEIYNNLHKHRCLNEYKHEYVRENNIYSSQRVFADKLDYDTVFFCIM